MQDVADRLRREVLDVEVEVAGPRSSRRSRTALLDLVLASARVARESAKWIEVMMLHEAVDPNLSRQLLLARVENGVAS